MIQQELLKEVELDTCEIVRTYSGEWYYVSPKDIAIFTKDTKNILKNYILPGNMVGLFLELDNANFNSIIIYQACIACGASVIRCGISDLNRQLPVQCDITLDWLICTNATFKYIKNKLKYNKCILVNTLESIDEQLPSSECFCIYEFFDIPGFAILNYGLGSCPGYVVSKKNNSDNSVNIQTVSEIDGFKIADYSLKLPPQVLVSTHAILDIVHDYIEMQIKIMLKESLNGRIDSEGNIELTSIGKIELLIRLEEEFGISISIDKVCINSFERIFYLADLIYSIVMEDK